MFVLSRAVEKLTDAVNAGFISLVTFIADASIGTESVDAQAISAEIGYSLALVDIWKFIFPIKIHTS